MRNKKDNYGLGVLDILALIFIVLKLSGLITWSWMWVLSPIWIQLVIVLLIFLVFFIRDPWLFKR